MKIKGMDSVREYGVAVIPRAEGKDLNLPIQSVGTEIEKLHAQACWHPSPPTSFQRDASGNLVRDADKQPVRVINRQDPGYRSQCEELALLHTVAYIYLGLLPKSRGGEIEWETDESLLEQNPLAFFRGIQGEMETAGFSQGAIRELFRQINELSMPSMKEVEAAAETFPDA